jgi:hypothetical protein
MNPAYPVYIVSKGRWQENMRQTSKALEEIGVPYWMVVEEHQAADYATTVDPARILVIPSRYFEEYDPVSEDEHKSNGPGPARNFVWDHAIQSGAEWHWVMDDNIRSFRRLNRNLQIKVGTGAIFKCMEDFVNRYENVAIAGPQYDYFLPSKYKFPPFVLNTRIYSCLLIRNDIPYRWRGRYNEDTDLCLRVLKDGWATIQFNAFIQEKKETQGMRGGNTDEFYLAEGTLKKSELLVAMHPDVASLTQRYGRWHHRVDYRPFKENLLIRKPMVEWPSGIDNYGMVVRGLDTDGMIGT